MRGLTYLTGALACMHFSSVTGFSVLSTPQRRLSKSPGLFMVDQDGEEELVKVPRRGRRGRFYDDEDDENEFFDTVEKRVYGETLDDDDWDDEDEDDYLYEDDEEDYGLFSNVIIDNPILDSIDPDGAAERFPELARDPRFWFDMFLFISFLNFLSAIGPQDYFPDIPYSV